MTVVSGNPAFSTTTSSRSGKLKAIYSPLWLCFLVAILSRVWIIVHTNGVMAGDEMEVGLQSEHILRGELPLYYFGQPYLGSLDAYVGALIFRFTGPAVWAMRLEMIPMSLLLVYLTWRFAAILAETAHLSARLKTTFMTIAALVAAFPPLYGMIMEMRVGGYMGAFVIMLWLLFCAFRLTQRWGQQASWRELALRWVGIGLLVGLGMWIDSLIIYACAAIAIWIGGWVVLELVKPRRHASGQPRLVLLKEGLLSLSAVPGLLIGFLPGLIWGAQNNWANVFFIFHLTGTLSASRLRTIARVTKMYTYCLAPRALGGALPTQPDVTTANPHVVTFGLFVVLSGLVLGVAGLFLAKRHPVFVRVRQLTALPLLFMLCVSIIFCITPNSAAALGSAPCGPSDGAGRYVVPLVDGLPFLIATLIVLPGLVLRERQRSQAQQGEDAHRALRFTTSRRSPSLAVTQIGLLVVLALYFGAQGIAYAQADPNYTFQATGCLSRNPTNVDPIVNYLKNQHIHYVWATNWVGDHITFETDDSIVATKTDIRIMSDYQALVHADRPSVLALAAHDDHHPDFLRQLDANHVTYRVARFYSAPGVDALVVTPLNRTLSPSDPTSSRLFQQAFRGCLT
jgi:hypothetical protein